MENTAVASSSASFHVDDTKTSMLVFLKHTLPLASKSTKLAVLDILRQHGVFPVRRPDTAEFSLSSLSLQCLTDLQNYLKTDVRKPEKRVTLNLDSVPVKVESAVLKELEMSDIPSQLSPLQAGLYKKLKDCTKNLIKHKRVYVEKDYGFDDCDEIDDLDLPTQAEEDDPEFVEEDGPAADDDDVEDDEETSDSRMHKVSGSHLHVRTKQDDSESSTHPHDDEETYLEKCEEEDMTTNVVDMDQDDTVTLPPDDDDTATQGLVSTSTLRLKFGCSSSVQERFEFYRSLLADKMDFADCSGLGFPSIRENQRN